MAKEFLKMGEFLAEILSKMRMTQRAFGEAIGVSRQNVNAWIKGEQLPPAHRFGAISNMLGVSIDELLDHIPENRRAKYIGLFDTATLRDVSVSKLPSPQYDSIKTLAARIQELQGPQRKRLIDFLQKLSALDMDSLDSVEKVLRPFVEEAQRKRGKDNSKRD